MAEDDAATVRAPVRVDFAGGWTDVHYFSEREGGAVLNAAINHYVEGRASWRDGRLRVEYELTAPQGSGLGSSAAINVAWLALTNRLMGRTRSRAELAEDAYRLEKLLGVEGGKQDHYASALGGFNYLTFGAEDEPAEIERLDVSPAIAAALEARAVLCYSGGAHNSGSIHEGVWERYRAGESEVGAALREMARIATEARDALFAGDLGALADMVARTREASRRLHPALVTDRMDALFNAGRAAGALGSKACGAGGGGCLIFICAPDARIAVERALTDLDAEIIPFTFASEAIVD